VRSGVLAEFPSEDALVRAWEELSRAGYARVTSFTPYLVRRLAGPPATTAVLWIMLAAALLGGAGGYGLEWWCNARSYPIDVGGRPLHAAVAFIPIAFESAVLASSVTGFIGMLVACGLPRLSHPVFEIDGFERATVDRFWIGVDEADPRFEEGVADTLLRMGALRCERLGEPR
jgi:hypothetical protein